MVKRKILIVDDSTEDRDAIVSAFRRDESARYEFLEAHSGAAGLSLLETEQEHIDLVVLDYRLPDMNARVFLETLLGDASIPPLPIVLLTGSTSPDAGTGILRRGVQDFFEKSRTSHEMLPRIARNAMERYELLSRLVASEQKAADAMLAAERANRAKTQFLASISHELRTPLAAIVGFAEILTQDPGADDAQRMLGMISSSGEHLMTVLNDLLDIAKVEAGTLEVDPQPCDIRQVLELVANLTGYRAVDNGLRFQLELNNEFPRCVKVDAVRLRQIMLNLIGNAIKYTSTGQSAGRTRVEGLTHQASSGRHGGSTGPPGLTRVACDGGPTGPPGLTRVACDGGPTNLSTDGSERSPGSPIGLVRCEVSYDWDCQRMTVKVHDTGPGIEPEMVDTIFHPFTQGPTGAEKRRMGIGLGLAISRHLASLMHGRLDLEQTSEHGSTFVLELEAPEALCPQDARSTVPEPTLPDLAALRARRALVVEDVRANRYLLKKILGKLGVVTDFAEDGREALEKVAAIHETNAGYDFVIMDMQMPVMDGYEATSILKQRHPGLPVVALTAATMSTARQLCLDVGCVDVLLKPINFKMLESVLLRICSR
ncbi:MAG: response regulator [Planctomycetales bacterium]|nr:response regulator [Planctomycetales bacterium]